jgi:Uma2 family endonuclease
MVAAHVPPFDSDPPPVGEQRVVVRGVPWDTYVALNDAVESGGIRMAYLRGALEIMSPSLSHETLKSTFGRLLWMYALERGLAIYAHGSTTFRKRAKEAGVEPDECYAVGRALVENEMPDLAVEVVLTSGGIDKLEIYARLGVREVWFWHKGKLSLYALREGGYEPIAKSELMPSLDVEELASFVATPDQAKAVLAYRDALRARGG